VSRALRILSSKSIRCNKRRCLGFASRDKSY
jgi:hypothetical protein